VALLALGLAVALASCLTALRLDIRAGLTRELAAYGPNLMVTSEEGLPADLGLPGAAPFAYRVGTLKGRQVVVAATDLEAARRLYTFWSVQGAWPAGAGQALLGARAAAELGVAPGARLQVGFQDLPARTFLVSGLVRSGGAEEGQLIVSLPDPGGQAPRLALARVEGGTAAVEAQAARLTALGLTARPIRRVAASEARLLERVEALMGWLTAGVVATCLLGAGAQMASLVWQRRGEIALMRALGAQDRQLLAQFLGEALALGLGAGVLGWAAGLLAAHWMARSLFGVDLHPRLPVLPLALGLAWGMALAAFALPVARALRLEPAPVLRGE
jgi:putative ABC transport system permease protein